LLAYWWYERESVLADRPLLSQPLVQEVSQGSDHIGANTYVPVSSDVTEAVTSGSNVGIDNGYGGCTVSTALTSPAAAEPSTAAVAAASPSSLSTSCVAFLFDSNFWGPAGFVGGSFLYLYSAWHYTLDPDVYGERANFENYLGCIVFIFDTFAYLVAWWYKRAAGQIMYGSVCGRAFDVTFTAHFLFGVGSGVYLWSGWLYQYGQTDEDNNLAAVLNLLAAVIFVVDSLLYKWEYYITRVYNPTAWCL
jgi:hypothetical protein